MKQYFAIAKRIERDHGITIDRHEAVRDFTEGKKDGLSQLNAKEKLAFIDYLNRTFPSNVPNDSDNQMRRKIISLFYKMGYENEKTQKIDMHAVNDWCIKFGRYHKALNAHSHEELAYLVTQVEKVYKSHIDGIS